MKINNYLPNLYNNNIEMKNIINSEEVEFEENIKPAIDNIFKDTFANVATENGIEQFEKILDIPTDTESESLNFRRDRVLSRLRSSIPFTETFLKESLDNYLGKNNWTYTIDYNNYTLIINSLKPGNTWYRELLNFLDSIIPCNIDWQILLFAATWKQVQDTFVTWDNVSELTWDEVLNGEWINS